jgi:cation diffusion facilitator CzcD-associated flavoprotein CzcO
MSLTACDHDVLIVGAGISGIGMAAHLEMMCPHRSYAVLERRANLGGTWDLFRYPGIRSDSDMHTLGFKFEPWKHEKSIADGPAILDYLHRIVDERGIREKIAYDSKVVAADWHSDEACWRVTIERGGKRETQTANWLYLGTGYYDYDDPYDAGFDLSAFEGQVIHPQFWPKDLDYRGKRVVVVGSGATAVTIVPAMSDQAAKVTMLQRTPTWMFSRPAKDGFANALRKFLPEQLAYRITRWKNVLLQDIAFKRARSAPEKVKDALHKRIQDALGDRYDKATWTPPYNPWEQRLCLVPDSDLFEAIKHDKADVVTGNIEAFDKDGVRLTDGRHLPADIIVTATGLKLAVAGKIAVSQDGVPVAFNERFYYKGCMFSNLPNFSVVFGYLNASWTLRADINSEFVCKVLGHMEAIGANVANPALPENHGLVEEDLFDFSSGYIQRGKHIMPKSAVNLPWRLNQDYRFDRKALATAPIDDGVLKFDRVEAAGTMHHLEAAE